MNAKRQTIWLVSMLSLMVVLSAYYLFTEDVNKLNTASDKAAQENIKVTTDVKDPEAGEKAVSGGLASSTQTGSSDSSKSAQGQTDAQVLDKMANGAQSGVEYFAALGLKRDQDFKEQLQKLMDITADTKKSSDEINKAHEEYEKMSTMEDKMTNLEELLGQTYKNAIILPEGGKYKAVVQADKLDGKQAQKIIDMMIKELGVSKNTVSVQYIR